MVTELELKQMVQQILTEMSGKDGGAPKGSPAAAQCVACDDGDGLPDLTEIDLRRHCLVPNPANREALMAMKLTTPSRIGVWRAGPRYMTETLLRFRADHAAAQDAVFTNVSDEFLEANKLETVQTECTSKDQFDAARPWQAVRPGVQGRDQAHRGPVAEGRHLHRRRPELHGGHDQRHRHPQGDRAGT